MPELKRTTEASKDKHFHALYLSQNEGQNIGVCSISGDKPHFHKVKFNPTVPAIYDETGQVVAEEIPASIELEPANKHTHEIVEFANVPKEQDTPEEEAVKEVYDCWKEAVEEEEDFFKEATEDEEFIMLKQWKDDIRRNLANEKRSCLSIDQITGKLDVLSGIQRQNRYDIKYYPRKGGSALASDMFTHAAKIYWDWNNADYEETEIFDDQITVGRGLWNCYVSYENSLDGEIILEKFEWDGVKFAPHTSKYLKDCQYFVKYEWTNKAKLKNEYPELADKISADYNMLFLGESSSIASPPGQAYNDGGSPASIFNYDSIRTDKDIVDKLKKKYVKLELHKRVYRRIPVAIIQMDIDPEDGRPPMFNLDGYEPEEIKQIKSIEGIRIVKQPISYIKILTVAGGVKLDEKKSDFNIFNIIPAYAHKRKKFVAGKVRNLKDPQREANKRHSQAMDIINNTANYTEFYDTSTFPSVKEEREYKDNANNPKHIQKVTNITNIPVQKQGIKVPSEILTMEELSRSQIEIISNIPREMGGFTSAQQSGSSQIEAKRASLQGNEFLFDNLALAKRQIGRWLLQAIPQVHTPESFVNMLYDSARNGEMIKLGKQPIQAYDYNQLVSIMEDAMSGKMDKYDVKVGESAASPTKRFENYTKITQAAQMGIQMPPELVIEYMDLPPDIKEMTLANMKAQQQAQMQQEQMKSEVELRKSIEPAIIAAQSKGAQQQVQR